LFVKTSLLLIAAALGLLLPATTFAGQAKVKIVLVGDSTVADQTGWGLGFRQFLTSDAECLNAARGGRSSKSFRDEGLWTNALALKGDYYLVQFGHNNQPGKPGRSTDMPTFVSNMVSYVEEARAIGAKPVLVTPLTRRQWDKQNPGKIVSSLEPYAEEVRKIAAAQHVPLVDLHARSIEFCESLGPEKCLAFSPPRVANGTNAGGYDGTHLNANGRVPFARLVVEELRKAAPELAPVLRAEPVDPDPPAREAKSEAAASAEASGAKMKPQTAIAPATPAFPDTMLNLTNFDALGDGVTLNSEAFARAIAELAEKGGGTLTVPPGIWLTGPIKLRSNINLRLERGALLKFSGDFKLYPLIVIDRKGEKEVDSTSPISGEHLENVAITGEGIIDGGGDSWRPVKKSKLAEADWRALVKSGGVLDEKGEMWWPSVDASNGSKLVAELRRQKSLNLEDYEPAHQFLRPKMLRLIACRKVLLEGVTFQNPPSWTINPALCEDVSLLNVSVHNSPAAQNSDALDLESCRRALVRGCTFDAGDDGICLKSGQDAGGRRIGAPTEEVLIEGCTVYHAHGGFTIGSEMSGGVRRIRVNNCTFIGTDVGLRFKSARGRGGVVENIDISNIRMTDIAGDAINFNMHYGGKAPLEEAAGVAENEVPAVTEETPQFRDIRVENVLCLGANSAIVLEGLPEMPLRGITLKNVWIAARQSGSVTDAENIVFDNVHLETKAGRELKTLRVARSNLALAK
jgi:DNA sulfur modification protein DndE